VDAEIICTLVATVGILVGVGALTPAICFTTTLLLPTVNDLPDAADLNALDDSIEFELIAEQDNVFTQGVFTIERRNFWGGRWYKKYMVVYADLDGDGILDTCTRDEESWGWRCGDDDYNPLYWYDYKAPIDGGLLGGKVEMEQIRNVRVGDYDGDGVNEMRYYIAGDSGYFTLDFDRKKYVTKTDPANRYTWIFRDDGRLQFRRSEWGENWTPWGYDDGACFDYFGDDVFADDDCDDVTHTFVLHADGRLQMKKDEWGGDWNPWGLSGGACFTYLGDDEFGLVACNRDDGDWVLNDRQQLEWSSNPWDLNGGACFNYAGDSEFAFEGCN